MVSTEVSKTFSHGSNPCTPTMDITFKYNDKIITTPNLEKKLKRLKISLEDIEIIDTPKKEKAKEDEIEESDKERVIIRSTSDNIRRVCYVIKGTKPPIEKLFEKQRWNPITKTGLYTEEILKTFYYGH